MAATNAGGCPHPWCIDERPIACTEGGQSTTHQGMGRLISAADDQLSIRPVAIPGFHLDPDEDIFVEVESIELVRPGIHQKTHILLTLRECDEAITALIAARASIAGSLANATPSAARPQRSTPQDIVHPTQ